jgi:hypothetical protein
MAGILDVKTRVMDFILTDEGRRQIRDGDLRISYASFSDLGDFYLEESGSVATDAANRIHFEAHSRHQDKIVVESYLGNTISSFSTSGDAGSYNLSGEQIALTPESPIRANETLNLSGSEVVDESDAVLRSITQNFTDNQLVAKEDVFSYKQGFELSDEEVDFRATPSVPIDTWLYTTDAGVFRPPGLASFDALPFDRRFAHFPNYKFLPPINKRTGGVLAGRQLGVYPNLNQPEILTYDKLKQELKGKDVHEIRFDPTSRDNNVMLQPFEFDSINGTVKKLVIVDYGVFPNERGTSAGVHVFFLGKMLRSRDGSLKYFNIFTLELDV